MEAIVISAIGFVGLYWEPKHIRARFLVGH